MDETNSPQAAEHILPTYDHEAHPLHEDVPAYEHAPGYETSTIAVRVHGTPANLNLTIDPTGTFIKTIPASDSPPLYTLNGSMIKIRGSTGSIHVQRADPNGGDKPLEVYAIGEHFISALHKPQNKEFRSVTAARSHGALVTLNVREIVWDFSTRVPAPKGSNVATNSGYGYPTDPVYMIGTAPGPGTVEKHLLQFLQGKVVDADDEVVALEREGGAECEGMPVLSVLKEVDEETMDFLVSAWLTTLWGQVGKRARRHSKDSGGTGKGFSIGKFKIGG